MHTTNLNLRTVSVRLASALIALATFANVATAAPNEKVFRAGAFAMDISPTHFPVPVNGSMQYKEATSLHDPLHARCLVLDDGTTKIAIVVCDSCMILREILDEAKKLAEQTTGIPTSRILISATHTHSAVAAAGVFQTDADPVYQKYMAQQIAKGIQKAHAQLEPARIGWAVGDDPTQVFNRRWHMKPGTSLPDPFGKEDKVKMNPGIQNPALVKPAGPVDTEVPIISVIARDGRPIALLANYSLHYVGGWPALSADYFGAFAERIKQLLKAEDAQPAFVGIMSNGTSGDINNINFAGPPPDRAAAANKIESVADSVAQAALAACKTIEYRDWVELKMAEREVELVVLSHSDSDVAEAEAILAKARQEEEKTTSGKTSTSKTSASGDAESQQRTQKPLKERHEIYARETVLLAKYPPTVKAKLQAIRIGPVGIVSTPCETFVEIGLAIKKNSPLKPTFTIELANGYNGYLPTPEQHELGGYETWRARSSYLEPQASTKIYAMLMELLDDVSR